MSDLPLNGVESITGTDITALSKEFFSACIYLLIQVLFMVIGSNMFF
jgi:hypothetical protein